MVVLFSLPLRTLRFVNVVINSLLRVVAPAAFIFHAAYDPTWYVATSIYSICFI